MKLRVTLQFDEQQPKLEMEIQLEHAALAPITQEQLEELSKYNDESEAEYRAIIRARRQQVGNEIGNAIALELVKWTEENDARSEP